MSTRQRAGLMLMLVLIVSLLLTQGGYVDLDRLTLIFIAAVAGALFIIPAEAVQ